MELTYAALAFMAGAFFYFLRGRGWKEALGPWAGTNTWGRPLWALPTGGFVWFLSGAPLWTLPVSIGCAFLALVLTGHGAHQSAWHRIDQKPADGRWTEHATFWLPWIIDRDKHLALYNAVGLAVVGVVRMVVTVAPAAYGYPAALLVALAGPLHAAAYFTGWTVWDRTGRKFDPLYLCEPIWGGFQWLALFLTLSALK